MGDEERGREEKWVREEERVSERVRERFFDLAQSSTQATAFTFLWDDDFVLFLAGKELEFFIFEVSRLVPTLNDPCANFPM